MTETTETETEQPEAPTPGPDQLPTDEERAPTRAKSVSDLKQRAIFKDVVLPSGAIVDLTVPNLAKMIKSGTVPNDLVDAALQHQTAKELTREIIEETWDYTQFILPHTLVSPEITREDVSELSTLDVELLVNIAARRTDIDAVGRQLGGLDTQESFLQFREILSMREALGGL